MILVVVLVVVALLSLAAYTFAELMLTHYGAAKVGGRQVQARAIVESGVESVRAYLIQDKATREEAGGHFENPSLFRGIPVLMNPDPRQRANFTVLVPNQDDEGNLGGVRYGLEDESTRLNVNALLMIDGMQENAGRDLLMGLPGMTEDVADAILDWIDADDETREYGAESDYYIGLDPPYAPKNGPLDTVEELLLVRGVTPQLMFGTDTNRNGMVDQHELNMPSVNGLGTPDPAATLDLGEGSLDRGWSGYLTLYSMEKNVNSEGVPRINLNMEDLEELYNSISDLLNEDWAKFIVAYRQYGPYDGNEEGEDISTVNGVDVAQPSKTQFAQVLDLIGKKIQLPGQDGKPGTVIASPFPDWLPDMMIYMPVLMDNCAASDQPTIPGRININQAPRAILMGIPGIEEEVVDEIISQRAVDSSDEATSTAAHDTETWILMAGLVTLDQMRTLEPFVCAGGSVYRAQIVGYYEDGATAARAEVIFDASAAVPRVVSYRDISHLGRGYPLELLGIQLIDGY